MTDVSQATGAGRDMRPASVKVWDPFVRLFHWTLVLFFAAAWITGDEWERLHELTGYAVAALVALRLVWGLIGTRHARFSDFVYRPSAVIGYLRDSLSLKAKRYLGHNPAGGAMVVALLLALSVAAATGVMTTMDGFLGQEWVEEVHEVAANLTIALVLVHLAGVAIASLQHRENLVWSMITGRKREQD